MNDKRKRMVEIGEQLEEIEDSNIGWELYDDLMNELLELYDSYCKNPASICS